MNTTPHTDDQILAALETALGCVADSYMIQVRPGGKWRAYWDQEKEVRLKIGKKFLEILSKLPPEPDPYATLKAYAKAGARIRFEDEFGYTDWEANVPWSWTQPPEEYQVHPADLHLLEVKPWTPKPGDVVQLKSGGAKMTVLLHKDEEYLCAWTSDYGIFENSFPLACLQQA